MVRKILKELKIIYPKINYSVVLAYMPSKKSEFVLEEGLDTIYTYELEKTPKKFAISSRNKWLVDHSDIIITYVKYCFCGVIQFIELAEKQGKIIIIFYNLEKFSNYCCKVY